VDYIGRKKDVAIDEGTIWELHKLTVEKILEEEASGKYREREVVIRNSITGEVSFRPPRAIEVEWQMKNLLEFIHEEKEIHPVLKAGIVHHEFVRIHPFLDGNGRVGRALSMLVLFSDGYDIREFFSLEEHFDRNAENYYKALQSVAVNNGDVTIWLEYFTKTLAIELSKIKDKIERISIDNKLKEKLGGAPVMLTERQIKIIEYIQEIGYLENKIFQNLFPEVSEDTALREIQDLVKKGIVVKKGKTKGVKYLMA
jgi:Fic family protein